MDTIIMNSKISQTSEPHVLILTFNDKLDLSRGENDYPSVQINVNKIENKITFKTKDGYSL